MTDPHTLTSELINAINTTADYMKTNKLFGNTEWTHELKKSIGALGESLNCKICSSTRDRSFGEEWLYDMVWYKENTEGQMTEVPLVVESEWSLYYKDVKYDFEKLLLANSPLKLLVCNCPWKDVDTWVENLKSAINACQLPRPGDQFLIAILQLEGYDAIDFRFELLEK